MGEGTNAGEGEELEEQGVCWGGRGVREVKEEVCPGGGEGLLLRVGLLGGGRGSRGFLGGGKIRYSGCCPAVRRFDFGGIHREMW